MSIKVSKDIVEGETAEAQVAPKQVFSCPIDEISPDPRNPRKHSRAQIRAIAQSIKLFGFTQPLLLDAKRQIIAGHGRYEAAKLSGWTEVPVIFLDHLSETEARAYLLADNQLAARSSWDDLLLATELKDLSELSLNFNIEATGFERPEVDIRIQSLQEQDVADRADEFSFSKSAAVSVRGDLWILGDHRVLCGDALEGESYSRLLSGEKAAACFTDLPYNVKIAGHVGGKGRVKHREFAMASGEMSQADYTAFLTSALKSATAHTKGGALIYFCMDWRHLQETLSAGASSGCELINLCVWCKTNSGMGSLYRSGHELVFVFRNGSEQHQNNIQLGRFGRNRSSVWHYAAANSFARKGADRALDLHPTPKPIAMVADAILDSTMRGEIVLDGFLGSGTTLLAAERTGRRCYGIEIDCLYVDTIIDRWQRLTGRKAQTSLGETFEVIKTRRGATR
jgi:DNA modification methylase